jgi:Tropinone reductase 1
MLSVEHEHHQLDGAAHCAQVNNAGMLLFKPAAEYTAEEYARLMATNLESCFHLSQLAHPLLLKTTIAGGGSIIHISSIASVIGYPWEALYSTSKGTRQHHPSIQ